MSEKQKKIVILIIVFLVILVVFSLIFVSVLWNSSKVTLLSGNVQNVDDATNNSDSVGQKDKLFSSDINKYSVSNSENKEEATTSYSDDLKELLNVENYDKLFEKIDENYLTSQGFNKESLKSYLVDNHLIGDVSQLEILSMSSGAQENDINIYRIKYKLKFYIGYVNLIETFPYEYTISFLQDTIPTVMEHSYTSTVNNIVFEITETTRREDSLTYKIKITNNNDDKVEFNFNSIANVALILQGGMYIKQTSATLSSRSNTLTKESYLIRNMYFPVSIEYQNNVTGIIFYNVKIGKTTEDIIVRF